MPREQDGVDGTLYMEKKSQKKVPVIIITNFLITLLFSKPDNRIKVLVSSKQSV